MTHRFNRLLQALSSHRRTLLAAGMAAAVIVPVAAAAKADAATTYYVMLQAEHSKKFVTVPNWTSGPEAAFQWHNADYPESQFNLKGNGDGTFQLQDRWNHLCLDLENNRTVAGTRVVQMPCDGTVSQDWSYNTQADAGSQFYRHVKNRYSGLVMDVAGASTAAGAQLITWPRAYPAAKHQRFNILGGMDASAAARSSTPRADASAIAR